MDLDIVSIVTGYSPESRIMKPWGYEVVLIRDEKYITKLIFIKEGHRLSLQYHKNKRETILPLHGDLILHKGRFDSDFENVDSLKIREERVPIGKSVTILEGDIHRFVAGNSNVLLLETSTGEFDDIVRLKDDYGR